MAGFATMGAQQEQPTPQAMPQQSQMMPQQAPQMGSVNQATPEEQEQLERFVARSYDVIYDDQAIKPIMQKLANENPIAGLAEATVSVVARVNNAAEKSGNKIELDVMMEAGREVLQELADLSTSAGIHNFQEDQDSLEGAFFMAIDQYRTEMQNAGKLDQATAQQDMQQLEQMSQSGEFEAILRQLAQRDEQAA